LAAVESGSIDAIVTWHNFRLHRSPKELEAFIDLVERSRVRLAVVTGGDYDLTTPDGRLSARIVGAVARKESEDRSRRLRRKHLELAELGRPAGQLGWGVRSEDERELVREAARRVLEGDGLMTIARAWNRNNARCYLCAGRRPGHQLGIIADPIDELVKEYVLRLLTTPSVREALLAQAGQGDDGTMGRALAGLGAAQGRLQALDDDFYVRGVLAERRYRSIRVKLEREIDRLHVVVDAATKQRLVLHPDPRAFWAEADFQQRRELVRLMIRRVEVMPGRPALRRFDASRVRIQDSELQPRTLLVQLS